MEDIHTITADQCRAARGFIGWTREELAKRSKVSARTIASFEAGQTNMHEALRREVREAFEKAGLRFTFDIGEGLYRPRK